MSQVFKLVSLKVPPGSELHVPQYLFECVRQLDVGDLLRVLELEEAVPAVTGHVDEDVGPGVGEEALGARRVRREAAGQQPHEVLHGHLVAAVVDLKIYHQNGEITISSVNWRKKKATTTTSTAMKGKKEQ